MGTPLFTDTATRRHQQQSKGDTMGTITIVLPCDKCKTNHEIPVQAKDYKVWISNKRKKTEDVFPYLTDDGKDMLTLGKCVLCSNDMFK